MEMNVMKKMGKALLITTLLVGVSSFAVPAVSPVHAAAATKTESHQQILHRTMKLAASGKTINSENFGIGSDGNAIVKKWGKPDKGSVKEEYLSYKKRSIWFRLSSKGKVFNIFDSSYKKYGI